MNRIHLEPVQSDVLKRSADLADGTGLYRLAFRIRPSFLNGFIELRFPEVLRSSMGFHFLDHYRTTLAPLSEPEPFPQWRQIDGAELSYVHTTREGLEFGGEATVQEDGVGLSFYVRNHSREPLREVEANMCLEFSGCPDFRPNTLGDVYVCAGGRMKDLSDASPSPARNGEVWPLILTRYGVGHFTMPKDSPRWTLIDAIADENLMAIRSADGRRLVGYAWDAMPLAQMSNCRYPCLHTGPGACGLLNPGAAHCWRGWIYFYPADRPGRLLEQFRKDWNQWHSDTPNTECRSR
jgi:hypothetical protein